MVDIDMVRAVSDIIVAFERRKAKYVLIGGLAVGLHSRPRSTKDADFIVQVSALSLPGLLEELIANGFEIDLIPTIKRWQTENLIMFYRGRVRIDWMQPMIPLFDTDAATYFTRANDEILIVLQCEHIQAVRDFDRVFSVPGVDADNPETCVLVDVRALIASEDHAEPFQTCAWKVFGSALPSRSPAA